jgi:hypothetical protein
MAALLLTACGGGGTAAGDGAPTNAQRAEAARLTAEQNPLCSTGTLGAYYWEVGDASGTLAAGEQGGGAITGNTPMNVASASKWPFAAYVLERRGDEPALVPYLNFTSGYSEFSNLLCQSDGTLAECMNGGRNDDEAARGSFHYQGGHMQQLGVLLGLGALRNDGLGAELRSVLGAELPLAYVSPQPPGGLRTTPHAYARFLRRLLAASADPLQLGAALGRHAVCTVASDTCAAAPEGESFLPEPFHYALGHWVEDNPVTTPQANVAYSSAGAFGFYPWVDRDRQLYGLVARENLDLSVRQGYASLQCGRLIRLAWKTGSAQ